MANVDITLRRLNGAVYDVLYPTTTPTQVEGLATLLSGKVSTSQVGANGGVASLDATGKIPIGQLPNDVFDSMHYFSTISTATINLSDLFLAALSDTSTTHRSPLGYYWVATVQTVVTPDAVVAGAYVGTQLTPRDSGVNATYPTTTTMEVGDWIIISLVTGDGTSETPYTVNFACINNTYETATASTAGIVTLADATNTSQLDAGTGVVTEDILWHLLGTAVNTIAKGDHTHSGVYQPVDTDLTAIAALAVTDGNFIVGNGSAWVAESGATARTSLGLTIGTDIQAYDAGLASIAGLTTVADRMIYTTASDVYAVTPITAAGRAILDDADASAQRTTLGLAIGTNVQAYDSDLATIAGFTVAANNVIVGNAAGTAWEMQAPSTARTSLGLAIGTNVQGWDQQLADIAAMTPTDSNFIVGNGTTFVLESGATARTSLGLTIGTDVQAYNAKLADIVALAVTDSNFIVGNGSTWVAESGATARTSLGVYSTTETDGLFTNRPHFLYDTTTGAVSGDIIFDAD